MTTFFHDGASNERSRRDSAGIRLGISIRVFFVSSKLINLYKKSANLYVHILYDIILYYILYCDANYIILFYMIILFYFIWLYYYIILLYYIILFYFILFYYYIIFCIIFYYINIFIYREILIEFKFEFKFEQPPLPVHYDYVHIGSYSLHVPTTCFQ